MDEKLRNTAGEKTPAEDVARIKGLGFLIDKRTGNTFFVVHVYCRRRLRIDLAQPSVKLVTRKLHQLCANRLIRTRRRKFV